MTLHFPKPPANITIEQLFSKLIPTVETAIKKGGNALLGHPILNATLSGKQWDVLNKVQKEMHSEYTIRREMLLTRLDCTIQSFQVSNDSHIYILKNERVRCLTVNDGFSVPYVGV